MSRGLSLWFSVLPAELLFSPASLACEPGGETLPGVILFYFMLLSNVVVLPLLNDVRRCDSSSATVEALTHHRRALPRVIGSQVACDSGQLRCSITLSGHVNSTVCSFVECDSKKRLGWWSFGAFKAIVIDQNGQHLQQQQHARCTQLHCDAADLAHSFAGWRAYIRCTFLSPLRSNRAVPPCPSCFSPLLTIHLESVSSAPCHPNPHCAFRSTATDAQHTGLVQDTAYHPSASWTPRRHRTVQYTSHRYSPASLQQAQSRLHRQGSTPPAGTNLFLT